MRTRSAKRVASANSSLEEYDGINDDWNRSTINRFMSYLWPKDNSRLRKRVVFSFSMLITSKLVLVIIPIIFKIIIDGLDAETVEESIFTSIYASPLIMLILVIIYCFGRFFQVGFVQLAAGVFASVTYNAVRAIANETFSHLHKLSLSYHLERKTGALSRTLERGNSAVETIVRFTIFNIFPTIIEFVFVFIVLSYYYNIIIAITMALTLTIYVVFTVKVTNWRTEIRRQMNEADSDAYSKAVDSLLNFETVKYFNNEKVESKRFDSSIAKFEHSSIKTQVTLAYLNTGQHLIFATGMTISLAVTGYQVQQGQITIGDFVMLNAYLIQMLQPLFFIGMVYRDIRQGFVDLESIFSLLKTNPEIEDKEKAEDFEIKEARVSFKNVSFSYDNERKVIDDISFEVPSGETLAIVGHSGAGKSTISRLLYRFYDVSSGSINIDGYNIANITQESLRKSIGIVPQDTVLFNDTIRYNIEYGKPGASEFQVIQASKLAQIHEFVLSLPKGYDTVVGERGLKLSGGEKQRVAIARTILKSPPILLLDEATSALDSNTERDIQTALDNVMQNRTTLIIAHRLSTIINSNRIIVMDNGKIVESGNHNSLLKINGIYKEMWEKQKQK